MPNDKSVQPPHPVLPSAAGISVRHGLPNRQSQSASSPSSSLLRNEMSFRARARARSRARNPGGEDWAAEVISPGGRPAGIQPAEHTTHCLEQEADGRRAGQPLIPSSRIRNSSGSKRSTKRVNIATIRASSSLPGRIRSLFVIRLATEASKHAAHSKAEPRASSKYLAL